MWKMVVAIAVGSTAGGLLRWGLSQRLNAILPSLALGTLASNLIAGYVIGVALAFFMQAQDVSPEWKLLVVTGFCGGLSTFSTFSAEIVFLLQAGRFGWALANVLMHLGGSLAMTMLGMLTLQALRH